MGRALGWTSGTISRAVYPSFGHANQLTYLPLPALAIPTRAVSGADDGVRTRDPNLGRVVLWAFRTCGRSQAYHVTSTFIAVDCRQVPPGAGPMGHELGTAGHDPCWARHVPTARHHFGGVRKLPSGQRTAFPIPVSILTNHSPSIGPRGQHAVRPPWRGLALSEGP